MSSVGAELPKQLTRVAALREQYREAAKTAGPQANFGPAIAMLTASITRAEAALGSGDVIACIQAFEDLKGYSE